MEEYGIEYGTVLLRGSIEYDTVLSRGNIEHDAEGRVLRLPVYLVMFLGKYLSQTTKKATGQAGDLLVLVAGAGFEPTASGL